MDLRSRLGIWRSVAMYYWKPFNKRRLKQFYARFIKPGDLCFDIGAHLGNRTNAWEALGARVIAVEPQPLCVRFMQRKFQNKSNITIVPKALGQTEGMASLNVSRLTPTISTLSGPDWRKQINSDAWYDVKWEDRIHVEVTTLDSLIAIYGRPAFCKIDVENHELEVLLGLSEPIPCISFEYYPPYTNNSLRCIEHLEGLGRYKFNYSIGESQKLESDEWLTAENVKKILSGFSSKKEYGDIYAQLDDTIKAT